MKSAPLLFCCLLFSGISLMMSGQIHYDLLYLEGDYDEILNETSRLDEAEAYYWHALILNKKGEQLASSRVLEEGVAIYPGNQKLELLLANIYYESGNYVKAKPLLEKYKQSIGPFIRLIELHEFQQNYQEAIHLLENRLESDSTNLSLLIHTGDNYYQLDSNRRALSFYEKVYSINPDDQATANKLASVLVKEKEYKRSVKVCNEVLSKDSLNRKFIRIKGSASFSDKDYKTSNICFRSLYEMGDSGLFVLKHLGLGEIEEYQYIAGRKHLLAAYKKDPNNQEICFALGRGFLNSTMPERGMYFLERLDSLIQPDTSILVALYLEKQSGYSILQDYDQSLACFQKVFSLDPQPQYLFYMASLYEHRLENPEMALEYYTRFLEVLPPPENLADNPDLAGQMRISLRSAAENSIKELREELFFEGKLKKE